MKTESLVETRTSFARSTEIQRLGRCRPDPFQLPADREDRRGRHGCGLESRRHRLGPYRDDQGPTRRRLPRCQAPRKFLSGSSAGLVGQCRPRRAGPRIRPRGRTSQESPSASALSRTRRSKLNTRKSGNTAANSRAVARWIAPSVRTGSTGKALPARASTCSETTMRVHEAAARFTSPLKRRASPPRIASWVSARSRPRSTSTRVSVEVRTTSARSTDRRTRSASDCPSNQ